MCGSIINDERLESFYKESTDETVISETHRQPHSGFLLLLACGCRCCGSSGSPPSFHCGDSTARPHCGDSAARPPCGDSEHSLPTLRRLHHSSPIDIDNDISPIFETFVDILFVAPTTFRPVVLGIVL
jgi:hypothetical protein